MAHAQISQGLNVPVTHTARHTEVALSSNGIEPELLAATTPFPWRRILVAGPDPALGGNLRQMFREFRIRDVVVRQTGTEAWETFNTSACDIIIAEFQQTGINGTALLQRFRAAKPSVPLLVIHRSPLTKDDTSLLSEMGIRSLLEKPFEPWALIQQLLELSDPKGASAMDALWMRLSKAADASDVKTARACHQELEIHISQQPGDVSLASAFLVWAMGDGQTSRTLAEQALRSGTSRPLAAGNLIARTLLKDGQAQRALKVLETLDSLAPRNIARLCQMADAEQSQGNSRGGIMYVNRAAEIDPENPEVAAQQARIAMSRGHIAAGQRLIATSASPTLAISYLNNRGIAMVRSGNISEGLRSYQETLNLIGSLSGDLRSKVQYNMALALARSGEQHRAKQFCHEAMRATDRRLADKAKALYGRIGKYAGTTADTPKGAQRPQVAASLPEEYVREISTIVLKNPAREGNGDGQIQLQPVDGAMGLWGIYKHGRPHSVEIVRLRDGAI